ncbi:MAG: TerC family protein [Gemmatimonadota bacterium]
MSYPLWVWIAFNAFVLLMLALDLGVFHRKSHEVQLREALVWSAVWIALALAFNGLVWARYGQQRGLEFLTGYLIEKSLSVDNIFVFVLIFTYFRVPAQYQHKVLFWGILGALLMRAAFIAAGVTLIQRFHWIIYVFGGFLVITGVKMAIQQDKEIHPEKNPALRLAKRLVPVTTGYDGDRFFTRVDGRRAATPLFVTLLLVETTDLIFAVDSIPAILAITHDPFIVYTSNVFAILGLRALYFALAGVVRRFHYLSIGLAAILVFVGCKMLLVDVVKVATVLSLGVIAAILAVSVAASVLWPPRAPSREASS